MDYTIHTQYTSNPQITEIPRNDRLTHKETFSVDRDGEHLDLVYCHQAFASRGRTDFRPFATFVNEFMNVNARFITPGSVALDIGAHDGDTALPIAACLGRKGRTYAFECSEAFNNQLQVNLGFNPELDIVGIPFALMPTPGIHEFLWSAGDYNGGAAETNGWAGTYTIPRLVRAITFQQCFAGRQQDLSRLSFVKIDTEGHDFHILWSFREELKQLRPVIHAEWFPRTDQYIWQLLQFLGYELFCGFTLEHLRLGQSPWRQDIVLVPNERATAFGLKV